MAATVRSAVEPGRQVHLVLEHHNDASHLAHDVDAQWNDDGHNVLHVLLTGEDRGYYADYADRPAEKLARCLAEGWVYQGEYSNYLGDFRGQPSEGLPPSAHVLFLQNHDQTGNRAFGERLTTLTEPGALEAAIALVMLCPQIPLIFMGEEIASRTPFLFFTDHSPELGKAVREGRRKEFAHFPEFADPGRREQIPDPNALQTFIDSIPRPDPQFGAARADLYRNLLALRREHVVPRLKGARSAGARVLGQKAVTAQWTMNDGTRLKLASNFASDPVAFDAPTGQVLYASRDIDGRSLPGYCTLAFLEPPQ
jgi:malto-oligosyltrehalose trehalohydrolase